MFIPSTFKRPVSAWKALNLRKTLLMASSVRLKPLNCSRLPCVYAFFFSSRRRHTRSLRDWSSDVCSSDLQWQSRRASARDRAPGGHQCGEVRERSEERRVGKECVNSQTPCLIMEGAEFTENIINGVERPVKADELLAFTLCVRAGNTDVLTDAEENVRQKLRAEGVM